MKIKPKRKNKTNKTEMQKTIQVSEVDSYLLSNPGSSIYVVHAGNILFKLTYFKGDQIEMTNYVADEHNSTTNHLMSLIKDPTFWVDGDIIYTFEGIKEFLDSERV